MASEKIDIKYGWLIKSIFMVKTDMSPRAYLINLLSCYILRRFVICNKKITPLFVVDFLCNFLHFWEICCNYNNSVVYYNVYKIQFCHWISFIGMGSWSKPCPKTSYLEISPVVVASSVKERIHFLASDELKPIRRHDVGRLILSVRSFRPFRSCPRLKRI